MSGMFKYAMVRGNNIIGRKTADFEPSVPLSGVAIAIKHCTLEYNESDRQTTLFPNSEDKEKFVVKVNGELITDPVLLVHGDRLLFGSHHYFLYMDPLVNPDEMYDWELAMKEANKD
jgi:hypothetical protein